MCKQLTRWTHVRIGSARLAEVACRTHPVGAKSLPGFTVRHGIRRAELAEVALRAQDVGSRQARGVAGIAGRTEGAVRAVGLSSDGVVRPVVAVVSLERGSRGTCIEKWAIQIRLQSNQPITRLAGVAGVARRYDELSYSGVRGCALCTIWGIAPSVHTAHSEYEVAHRGGRLPENNPLACQASKLAVKVWFGSLSHAVGEVRVCFAASTRISVPVICLEIPVLRNMSQLGMAPAMGNPPRSSAQACIGRRNFDPLGC